MHIVLYVLVIIIAVIIILALIAPKKYRVSRRIMVNKPKAEVFEYLKYIKN